MARKLKSKYGAFTNGSTIAHLNKIPLQPTQDNSAHRDAKKNESMKTRGNDGGKVVPVYTDAANCIRLQYEKIKNVGLRQNLPFFVIERATDQSGKSTAKLTIPSTMFHNLSLA